MPKFVVFSKNSILLALLVSLFFANSQVETNAPKPSPLTSALHCFIASKDCADCGGFVGDTLVKTPTGYEKIRDLQANSLVITFDETTGYLSEQPITAVATVLTTQIQWLTLDDKPSTTICAGTTQTFYGYNPLVAMCTLQKYTWLQSSDLQNANLFTSRGILPVRSIKKASQLTKLHLIEVAETHNFFVTKVDLLVHNNPLALPFVAEVTAETAMLVAAGAKMVLNAVVGNNEIDNNSPKDPQETITPPVNPEINTASSSGSPGDPDKPPKKDDDEKLNCKGECNNKTCKKTEATKDQQITSEKLRAESEKKRADQAAEHAKQHREDRLAAETREKEAAEKANPARARSLQAQN